MKRFLMGGLGACIFLMATVAFADVKVDVGHNGNDGATADFKFKEVPSPVKTSATTKATIAIVDGDLDPNSGSVDVLKDGKLPESQDDPESNLFFNAGTDGGRLVIDLGGPISVKQINTYSWHTGSRAPQVYSLYAADGAAAGFNAKPGKGVDPATVGWKLIATVDTRPKAGEPGGQYGVSISDSTGLLGKFRYLLVASSRTDSSDDFSNTFFSKINVIDANAPAGEPIAAPTAEEKAAAKNVQADLNSASHNLGNAMPDPADLLEPAKRAALAPQVTPLLKAMIPLLDQAAATHRQYPGNLANESIRDQACLAYLGDADTIKNLQTAAAGADKAAALRAYLAQSLAAWWQAAKDQKAQASILADMRKLGTASPTDGSIFFVLMTMKDTGAASPESSLDAEGVVADTLTGGDADFVKAVHLGHVKQNANMNKPIEFAGKTVDDKDFSTTEYKGKVVLIDFWATWCHPCVAELPRVKAMYAKYHDQGLEIVGISCDADGAKLADFTKKDDMPWVQMWDKKAQSGENSDNWHPLTKVWGILSIPQMFLIDRNGNLRTVEARENMEDMIPKLLAEKAGG